MPLKTLTAPFAAPIHVAEARLHVKQDIADDDAVLAVCIGAARDTAESETERALVSTKFELLLDAFPHGAIVLPRSPIIRVHAVEYRDGAGDWQTVLAAAYVLDDSGITPRIAPAFGTVWPVAQSQVGSVRVVFSAGYAASVSVDATTNVVTLRGWKDLAVDDVLRFSNSGGTLPAPLQAGVDYYVKTLIGADACTLSATAGGSQIDITSAGSGLHFVGAVPDGIKAWMLLRTCSLYEHRGEVAVTKGALTPLPYVDRMLDPFRAGVM